MRSQLPRALASVLLLGAPLASAQDYGNFNVYVALGDSLSAGVVSSSLVQTHQRNSSPALLARQGGVREFQQPTVTEPGLPPELVLVSLLPNPLIAPKATVPGAPNNLALSRPYNNLAVPGASTVDLLTRTTDDGGSHDLVLRGQGTALQQAVALRPTLATLWIGHNDVLGAATRGRAIEGVTLTPAAVFRAAYQQIVATLRTTGAAIVAGNLADVTSIPYVTTVPPYVIDPATGRAVLVNGQTVPLLGPSGPLASGSYVTLAASGLIAQGVGVPVALGGTGRGLPDEVVLDPNEIALIRDRVQANNAAIREICGAAGIPVVDFGAFLAELATRGREVGGVRLSSAFLSGGVFSYDGVHPGELGYALIANEWIRALREKGAKLEDVNLAPFLDPIARTTALAAPAFEFSAEAYASLLALFPRLDRP